MVTVTIDGKIIRVEQNTPLLQAAKKLDIFIPTLCHHDAIKPYGSCRLCVVEVIQNNRSRLVTSCNFPADEGLYVLTSSDRVKDARRMVMELLLVRCPNIPFIQQLSRSYGVGTPRLKRMGDESCILCGLCVRVCDEVVGARAISFVNRGIEREVHTPFQMNSDVCIGCGTCTYICPTSCIEMVDSDKPPGGRCMNMGDLKLGSCPSHYKCETCDVDSAFSTEMKRVIENMRE